ncbi:T9SS type B sorting domain-containing protein [Winogradskyella sp. Asnod2-B02-A]|uniref:T9SS type B sorting domain-containing protein n=1 Tax=Winogradskyella sp. Asnod2-B02-A TaxID=3160583 RepID=UPI00386DAA29
MKLKSLAVYLLQLNFIICYCQSTKNINLNVEGVLSCEANFVSSLINADQNEIVTFSETCTNANNFNWNFLPNASSATSSEENPQVSFNQNGATTVNLSTFSNDGCTDEVMLSGPNIVSSTQNIEDCWTLINKGIDIYNGQYTYAQFPGYHDPEIMDLTEVQDGFITCGHYNEQIFDSKYGVNYSGLQNKNGSYLTKHNKDGLLKWIVYTEKNSTSDRDVMYSTVEDTNGDIYVSGHSRGVFYDNFGDSINLSDIGTGGFIIKLNSSGKIIWHLKSNHIFAKRLHLDDNNNLLISGDISGVSAGKVLFLNDVQTDVLTNFNVIDVNRFFLKIDSSGDLQWYTGVKTTGPNSEFLEDIGHDGNNNLYLTGYCSFSVDIYSANSTAPIVIPFTGNSPKLFLIKFEENGQIVWKTKSYVDNPDYGEGAIPRSIITDGAGNSYITGSNSNYNSSFNQVFENTDGTLTSEGVSGFFIAKINTNGICEWIRGAANVLYGGGSKIIKSEDEIIAIGSVSNNNSSNPLTSVEFLSTNGSNLQMSFYPGDFFLTVYDAEGNLKRVITNGINTPRSFSRGRISGFFKDDDNNYFLSRNINFLLFGPQTYENFSHTIEASNFDGIDGTITKFTEECGIVTYNAINQNIQDLIVCDDTSVGSNSDGLVSFNLLLHEENIINSQSASDYLITYYTDAGLINQISNPENYENSSSVENIYINVEFLATQNNSLQTSYTIEVIELPTVTPLVEINQCDDDSDGFSSFNLTEVNAEISTNFLNETITFYESQLEAETNTNPITEPDIYANETINTDAIWARVENANGCFATSQINLNISSSQIPNTFFRDFYECDAVMDQQDGISVFDFSSVNGEVQALFPAGQMLEISYYESLTDALAETNTILDISNYSNTTPNTQDIYIRVENSLNNECVGLGHYITLHILEVPLVTGPIIIEQCDEDNDGTEAFSTSSIEQILSEGQPFDVSFLYYDEEGNALPSPLPDPYITSQPITNINVTLIGEEENNPIGGCEVTTNIALVINSGFNIGEIPQYFACLDTLESLSHTFDTSDLEDAIVNGQSDINVSFFDEGGNLLESPFPDEYTLTESAIITAVISNVIDPMCSTELDINFIVTPKPLFWAVEDVFLCFEEGEAQVFDLSAYLDNALADSMLEDAQISAFNNDVLLDDIINADFESGSAIISYRIENLDFPDCYTESEFSIYTSVVPTVGNINDMVICDDESNDGFEAFNLEIKNVEVLNGLSSSAYVVSYHLSYDDAVENSNALSNPYTNIVNSQTIYARLSFGNYLDCYDIGEFNLVVKSVPNFNDIKDEYYLCKGDDHLVVSAGDGLDYYFWSTGATTSSITISEPGQYTITAIREYTDLSCEISKSFNVYESSLANQIEVVVTDGSLTTNNIEILPEGTGDYEYSIDGVNYQDSNMFYDLNESNYTIYIRDKNGCGVATQELFLLRYPRFFTPNQDTKNDYWQLYNSSQEPANILLVFDRYGKLLVQLDPMSRGWDGTFNGAKMPSDDYWFLLQRQNGETHAGHFALVR